MKKLRMNRVRPLIELAVVEDFGNGDPTSNLTIDSQATAKADLISREEIVVCGMPIVEEVLKKYDTNLKIKVIKKDGQRANVADKIGTIEGPMRPMLSAERVVLNFLQRLCGIATLTYKYVTAVRGTGCKIYDTRKTTPGWRELEKYAVRCGKGHNHRYNLGEAVMIKDNHIAAMGKNITAPLTKMVKDARDMDGVKFVCVEVDHVDDQLDRVLKVPGIDIILLDNMGQWQYKHAVEIRNKMTGDYPLLEASGGINLQNVRQVAQCGVDRISIGAITHSATAVDIGLDSQTAPIQMESQGEI